MAPRSVHRWRYALPAAGSVDGRECWWDAERGLGVCGDCFSGGDVEAAWRSAMNFADTVSAWMDAPRALSVTTGTAEPVEAA